MHSNLTNYRNKKNAMEKKLIIIYMYNNFIICLTLDCLISKSYNTELNPPKASY